jgi:hypothetical protein
VAGYTGDAGFDGNQHTIYHELAQIFMPYNLKSPKTLLEPIDPNNIECWFAHETTQVEPEAVRHVLRHVADHLKDFVQWPLRAVLLWDGCDRLTPAGKKQKYHRYPESISGLAKAQKIILDSRPNGPASAAFAFAGGRRPERFGSTNAWTTHHVYSGKFPYIGHTATTHAVKLRKHFTQSAGVIATHPVADALCDEYPFFTWLLRYEAFRRFGYDPDGVFSPRQDALGFADGHESEIVFCDPAD